MITIQRSPEAAFEQYDEALLVKTEGVVDDENERTTWVEYRFPGSDVIVHRSVHVQLKKGVVAESAVGGFL